MAAHGQEGARAKVRDACCNVLRLIGRAGVLDDRQMRTAMELCLGVNGSVRWAFDVRSMAF